MYVKVEYLPYVMVRVLVYSCFLCVGGTTFRNFACVTYNWDDYMTCRWSMAPEYNTTNYVTRVTWQSPAFATIYLCPNPTTTSCTWYFGGYGQGNYIDPYQPITVCLQVRNGTGASVANTECHNVDIERNVEPSTVTDLYVETVFPNCLSIKWTHPKVEQSKIYSINISSEWGVQVKEEVEATDYYSSEADYGGEEDLTHCNISYYTHYTIYVTVRPLDYNDQPVGYWSKPSMVSIVSRKNVPSSPPYLPPGGFTLSAINNGGYRTATVYWAALPKHSWKGDDLVYMLEATSVAGCGSSPVTLSTKAIFAEFPILYTCSYNIKVWSSNEIGRSRDGSLLHLQQQALPLPVDVFMARTGTRELAEISWRSQESSSVSYTVYWCRKSPIYSCKGSLHNKTVVPSAPGGYCRTTVEMDPGGQYVYGVSAEQVLDGVIVSSGFKWTDCTMKSIGSLRYPKLSFQGYPSEDTVTVTWRYQTCAKLLITTSNETRYHLHICHSDPCTGQLSTISIFDASHTSANFHSLAVGDEICVSIAVELDSVLGETSQAQCYTQQKSVNKEGVRILLIGVFSVTGLAVVIIIGFIVRLFVKWWWEPIPCATPQNKNSKPQSETDQIHTAEEGHLPLMPESAASSGKHANNTTTAPLMSAKV